MTADNLLACHGRMPTSGTRREFLAASIATLSSALIARAQASTGLVDVHHHLSPPTFIDALVKHKLGERPMLDWTPARSIEDMDRAGVSTSITSITTPGVWFGDAAEARQLARECNEFAAKLATQYPGRFGTFASIPLPDVDGCLKEIEYAFDVLKVDGVGVMTSFGDQWLGDATFAPVMEELNRRKAVVYTHPSVGNCCRNLLPDVHYSVIELATDTTRAIANLIFTGTTTKYPGIRYIFSHAGGTVPFIYQRLTRYPSFDKAAGLGKDIQGKVPDGVMRALQGFYYDTAQAAHPMAMVPLKMLVSSRQIVFGTDFPFRTAADHVKGLKESGFEESELLAIYRNNALRILTSLTPK